MIPKINLAALKDIKIKAGTPLVIDVPYESEPEPTATWKAGDVSLKPSDRVELKQKEGHVTLRIERSERGDSGPYTITLENGMGKDKATINVTVLDVPSEPEGPLKISDVHKTGCKLDWKPPADDGGNEILHYVVEKMDTSRGTWQEVRFK